MTIPGHSYVTSGHIPSGTNPYENLYYVPRRETEQMTIYDVLRHIVNKIPWDGMDFNEENARKTAATTLIDRLEEMNLLGKIAIDIKEEI